MRQRPFYKSSTISLYNQNNQPLNRYQIPSTLTTCKYIVLSGYSPRYDKYFFVTNKLNREAALLEIFNYLKNNGKYCDNIYKRRIDFPFRIYITENGVTELLIDSKAHKDFVDQYK